MRIYANYSQDEYNLILKKSEEMGFSPSAYVKCMSLLHISERDNIDTIQELNREMDDSLKALNHGDTFIVSSLLSSWVSLTRGTKMAMSKRLCKIIKSSPDKYEFVKKLPGKINQYRKI